MRKFARPLLTLLSMAVFLTVAGRHAASIGFRPTPVLWAWLAEGPASVDAGRLWSGNRACDRIH